MRKLEADELNALREAAAGAFKDMIDQQQTVASASGPWFPRGIDKLVFKVKFDVADAASAEFELELSSHEPPGGPSSSSGQAALAGCGGARAASPVSGLQLTPNVYGLEGIVGGQQIDVFTVVVTQNWLPATKGSFAWKPFSEHWFMHNSVGSTANLPSPLTLYTIAPITSTQLYNGAAQTALDTSASAFEDTNTAPTWSAGPVPPLLQANAKYYAGTGWTLAFLPGAQAGLSAVVWLDASAVPGQPVSPRYVPTAVPLSQLSANWNLPYFYSH